MYILLAHNLRKDTTMDREAPVKEKILTEEEAAERAARKAAAREERKRKKRRKKMIKRAILIALAVIFVLAAAAVGLVFYLQSSGKDITYDNITECVQGAPMEFSERYDFSADAKTITVNLDKNDLWWMLYQTGAIEKLESLDAALAKKNMRMSGMSINTDNGALEANVELSLFGKIRLPITAQCGVAFDDSNITVAVESAKFANGWGFPLRWFCARFDKTPADLAIAVSRELHPILSDLKGFTVNNGKLGVTCGAGEYLYANTEISLPDIATLKEFGVVNAASDVVVEAANGTLGTAYNAALASFEADPNAYINFRNSAFALTDETAANEYFNGAYASFTQRFLPGVTADAVTAISQEAIQLTTARHELLNTLATNLNTAYNKGTVALPKAEDKDDKDDDKKEETTAAPAAGFVNTALEGSPALTMEQMAGDTWTQYSEWLTEADMKAVYLTNFPNTVVQPTTTEEDSSKKKDKDEEKTEPLKPIGLLVRMKDGNFRLYYCENATSGAPVNFLPMDSATGEGYIALSYIPSVTYVASAAAQSTPAQTTEAAAPAADAAAETTADQAA